MSVAFGSIGIATTPTAANDPISVPYPSGIVKGDPLILAVVNGNPVDYTTPTGWTVQQHNGNVLSDTGGSVMTKVADGTESGSLSVSEVGTPADVNMGVMLRYTNYQGTTPVGTSSIAVSSSSSTSSPAHTTLSPVPGSSAMVVRFFLWAENTGSPGSSFTAPGGGWTTRANIITNITSGTLFNCGIVVQDKLAGTDDQTCTCSAAGAWIVVDIVITAGFPARPLSVPYRTSIQRSAIF